MAGNTSTHRRAGWIVVLVIAIAATGIGAMIWVNRRSHADVTAQREAMRQASGMRLRIKIFMDAAQAGDVKKVTDMLHTDPNLINAKDSDGAGVLHQAAAENQTAAVALLLDHGAAVNQKGPYGPPLEWAVYDGAEPTVRLLLQRGATADADMLATAERGCRGAIHSSGHIPHEQYARIASMLEKAGIKPDAPVVFMSLLNDPNLPLPTNTTSIHGQWSPAVLQKMNANGNLIASTIDLGANAHRTPDGVALHDSHEYTGLLTAGIYSSPLQIDFDAMTDGTDLHIYFGPSEAVFNYGYVLSQLSVLDPALGHYVHIPNQKSIPAKQFVKIKWIFTDRLMEIFTDGQLRYQNKGDYSHVRGRIGVGPALRSTVTVRSIVIKKLPRPTTKASQ